MVYNIKTLHKIPKFIKILFWILEISIALVCSWKAQNYASILIIVFVSGISSSITFLYIEKRSLNKGLLVFYSKLTVEEFQDMKEYLNVYFKAFVAKYYFLLMTIVGIEMSGIGFLYSIANIVYKYILVLSLVLLVFISIDLSSFIIIADDFNLVGKIKNYYTNLKLSQK